MRGDGVCGMVGTRSFEMECEGENEVGNGGV